jgi:hypothetical protein
VGRQVIIRSPGGIFDAMLAKVTMMGTGSPTQAAASDEVGVITTKYGLESIPS